MSILSVFQNIRTLRIKFLTIILPSVIICFLIFSILHAFLTYRDIEIQLDTETRNVADLQSKALTLPVWNYLDEEVKQALENLLMNPDIIKAVVRDTKGRVIARAGKADEKGIYKGEAQIEREITFMDTNAGKKVIGFLSITFHQGRIYQILYGQFIRDFLLLLLLLIAIVGSALAANKLAVEIPLYRLLRAIRKADEEDVQEIVHWPARDELGRVIKAYNSMVESLKNELAQRKQAEKKIGHLNTVLRAIRNVNQLITKKKDQDSLLKGSCDTLIETRGYYNAWVALFDESGNLLKAAEAGLGDDFLPLVEQMQRGELTDCGQKALKQAEVVITENPISTCVDCPLAEIYSGRAALTIQLEHDEEIYGLMSVSVPKDFAESGEEQSLFKEVAGDIALALHVIKLEEERKQAEEELAKHREHLEELIKERTAELQKTINLMAGREVRMAELKETIQKLRVQVESAGMTPVADDPLKEI